MEIMSNVNNTFITKFNLTNRYVYIKFIWKPNDDHLFHAKVFDSDSVFSGTFSNESMKRNYERIEESEEIYCSNTLHALRDTSHEFIYDFPSVNSETNTSKFSWKRKLDDGYTTLYGSFTVDRRKESKDSLIDLLLMQNKELNSKIEQYQKSAEEHNENLNRYRKELEKFTGIKTSLEANLYGKFVQVLNEKKKRIELLENHLQKINGTDNMCVDNNLL